MKSYRSFEEHIIHLFNSFDGPIIWNNKKYDRVAACKPYPQRGIGECKTDVYVLLNDTVNGKSDEIKISVKKDDAEFLANKLTPSVAEDLFGINWSDILTKSIDVIKKKFLNKKNELVFTKLNAGMVDTNFTLGWKLEVTNKERNLSAPLKLNNNEIIKIIFKGESQTPEKKDSIIFGQHIQKNSGVADYLIIGTESKYSNSQDVINDLIHLNNYNAGDIYLAFTANNFRYIANKADGSRYLAVAVKWNIENNRLCPSFIFDKPLEYQGERDMMPKIKECLVKLGVISHSDINIDNIKPI